MKRRKFLERCAKRSSSTVEHVLRYHDIVRCDCRAKKCPGWKAVYRLRNQRRKIEAA